MQRLEVSGAVRPIYGSLGVKRIIGPRFQNKGQLINSDNGYDSSILYELPSKTRY